MLVLLLGIANKSLDNKARTPQVSSPGQSQVIVNSDNGSGAPATAPKQTPPSQDDTANWHTYTNSKYGYQISYPLTGLLDASDPLKVSIKFSQAFESEGGSQGTDEFSFNIAVQNNPKHISPRVRAQQSWNRAAIKVQQDININGVAGYKIRVFEIDQDTDYIYLAGRDAIYILSFWEPQTMNDFTPTLQKHYAAIFQKMVSSFHFDKGSS